MNTESQLELNTLTVDGEIANILANSVFTGRATMKNKQEAVQYCILNDVIFKRKAKIEQLRNGMNDPFSLAEYVRVQALPTSHLFPSHDEMKIDCLMLKSKIQCKHKIRNEEEERALNWFM